MREKLSLTTDRTTKNGIIMDRNTTFKGMALI
jgi:hypothetical protein